MPQTRRRLSADVRREQILEVASRLFIERGFENVKMADIAEQLQTSRPNIYTYYHSTEAILDTLLERRAADWLQEIEQRVAEDCLIPTEKLLTVLLEHQELLGLLYSGGGPQFQARRQAVLDSLDKYTLTYLPPDISAAHPDLILMQRTMVLSTAHELLLHPEYDRDQMGHLLSVMLLAAFRDRVPDITQRLQQHHGGA